MDNNNNQLTGFGTQLDKFMMPINSPITRPSPVIGMLFDIQTEIQGRFARLSNVNIKNFVIQTGTSTASFGLANNGSAVITSRTSSLAPHATEPMFAQLYVALYQGTAPSGTGQVFPSYGSGINPLNYRIYGGHDWQVYNNQNTINGDTSNFALSVVNVSGGSQSFYYVAQAKYIQYNAGTTT